MKRFINLPRPTKSNLIADIKPTTSNATKVQSTGATHPKRSHLLVKTNKIHQCLIQATIPEK